MLAVGAEAPDFKIGKTSLADVLRKRKVVLFFFPKAFTPG